MQKSIRILLKEDNYRRFILLLLFVSVICCYWEVLVKPYAFSDDYVFFYTASLTGGLVDPSMIIFGRPLDFYLLQGAFSLSHKIGDLRYVRLIGISGIALVACLLNDMLLKLGWKRLSAASTAFIICTLPSFQVFAAWAVAAFYPLAICASLMSASLAEKGYKKLWDSRKLFNVVGAIVLTAGAAMIYQPTALYSCVAIVIFLLAENTAAGGFVRRLLWHLSILLSGLGVAFAQLKFMQYLSPVPPATDRSRLANNVLEKIVWFLKEPLTNSLNLHQLFPLRYFTYGCGFIILTGLFLSVRGRVLKRLFLIMIFLSLIPLSYLPNLIIAESWPAYRSLVALGSLVALYAVIALRGYTQFLGDRLRETLFSSILVVGAIACGISASHNVHVYFVCPQLAELQFIRDRLSEYDSSHIKRICLVMSSWRDHIAPGLRYDEFGVLTSSTSNGAAQAMVYAVFKEWNPLFDPLQAGLLDRCQEGNIPSGREDTIVLDMRDMRNIKCN